MRSTIARPEIREVELWKLAYGEMFITREQTTQDGGGAMVFMKTDRHEPGRLASAVAVSNAGEGFMDAAVGHMWTFPGDLHVRRVVLIEPAAFRVVLE